jgi:hypothetical protein
MLLFTGHFLAPAYHPEWFAFHHGLLTRLQGVLFSPSRGLLIYMPVVLIPLYLTIRYWRVLPEKQLALLSIAVIVSIIGVVVSYSIWWSGWSYGPRDLGETIPWFVLLTIVGLRAFSDDSHLTMHECSAFISAAILLLFISVAMNAPGALSLSANTWNARWNIDEHPEHLWDWQHPQFLAWLQYR